MRLPRVPTLPFELDREDNRGLRALDAVDTPDGVQAPVDLLGARPFDANL
jgi:hypothetical protein